MMTLKTHRHENMFIIAPGGKLTITENGDELLRAVHQALESGITNILFEFSAVEFIDSLGVGQIVASYTAIKIKGGHLILCGLRPRILLVLRMTNLHLILDIKDQAPGDVIW
jgi:anti-anti-sigma factor